MLLGNMDTFTGKHFFVERIEDNDNYMHDHLTANDGSTYDNYYQVVFDADYLLNGEYSTFTGTVYLPEWDKNSDYWQRRYVILSDNKVVYNSVAVNQGVFPEDFSIDVTGAKKMTIMQQCDDIGAAGEEWEDSNGSVYIGNAALWR